MNNANIFDVARSRLRAGIADLNRKWGWYFALGAFLLVLGSFATVAAVATTLLSVVVLGWILLVAGAGLIVLSFLTGRWNGFLLTLAAGVLSAMAGITTLSYPVSGAAAITLIIAGLLIAAGIYRSAAAIVMRFPNWGWSLVSGFVSLLLGTMLLSTWQSASLWFLGLFIGVDLIIHGFSWMMFALRIHTLAIEMEVDEEDRRAA